MALPSRAAPCLANPGPRLFSEQLVGRASKMSCFWRRLKSASRQHGTSVAGCRSGRRERGLAGAAAPVPGQSWAGWGPMQNVQEPSRGCEPLPLRSPPEGDTTRQRVPEPPGGERSPGLGTGWLLGVRRWRITNDFLCVLVNPKFASHLSVKLFQEGSLGSAPASWVLPKVDVWVVPGLPPPLSSSPLLCTQREPAGEPQFPPVSATLLLLIPGLYERSGEGKD